MTNDVSLKYPVVLVHGIGAKDRSKIINFWGRIPKILKERGIQVFLGNTDSWGDCDSNAKLLKATIDKILLETRTEKVNIIAHSKGGIDSRYFIWKYNSEDKISSLTTLSTPHNGSELADLIYKKTIFHSGTVKKVLNIFGKLYGDINPDLYNANCQLTSEKMKEFNESIGMDDKVFYQSLYTTIENPLDDLMMFHSHRYLKSIAGENDGIVSENSAKWGKNINKIEGGISHTEIIDLKRKSGVNIPTIYKKIINELSSNGF